MWWVLNRDMLLEISITQFFEFKESTHYAVKQYKPYELFIQNCYAEQR